MLTRRPYYVECLESRDGCKYRWIMWLTVLAKHKKSSLCTWILIPFSLWVILFFQLRFQCRNVPTFHFSYFSMESLCVSNRSYALSLTPDHLQVHLSLASVFFHLPLFSRRSDSQSRSLSTPATTVVSHAPQKIAHPLPPFLFYLPFLNPPLAPRCLFAKIPSVKGIWESSRGPTKGLFY